MSTVCPPDAYQHEPNAPAHRHDERCRAVGPEARIARLEAANAVMVTMLESMRDYKPREVAKDDFAYDRLVRNLRSGARAALARAKELEAK